MRKCTLIVEHSSGDYALFVSADVFKIATYDVMLVPVTKVGPGQMN
jgi:hypothetical protein